MSQNRVGLGPQTVGEAFVIAGLATITGRRKYGSACHWRTFLFEGFRLDRWGLFWQDERGVFAPVAIGSRALDVLGVLVTADGDLVSKDEIMAAVWPGTVVEDNNLTVQISTLRRVLDPSRVMEWTPPDGICVPR